MRFHSIQSLCLVWLLLMCCSVSASDVKSDSSIEYLNQNQISPKASITDVSWIAGNWHGEVWGGVFEEIWSKPSAGSMMASFKFIQEDQVKFYELMTIAEDQGSLVLRLKHFDPQLKGWEEKDQSVDFKLVRLTKDAVYFEGYTYKIITPNELHVFVMIENKGEKKETKFVFKRLIG